jgi:hypothetical protein
VDNVRSEPRRTIRSSIRTRGIFCARFVTVKMVGRHIRLCCEDASPERTFWRSVGVVAICVGLTTLIACAISFGREAEFRGLIQQSQ